MDYRRSKLSNRVRSPLTKEHRAKISKAKKGCKSWNEGKKAPIEALYKNMACSLRFDVSWEWLAQFGDINRLRVLNKCITPKAGRFDVNTRWYKSYIKKFYDDPPFVSIYNAWIASGKETYRKPSVDHIKPISKGGTNALSNVQFLTWFENRCKNAMTQKEWDGLKEHIQTYFV